MEIPAELPVLEEDSVRTHKLAVTSLVAALTYALLVLLMWGPFSINSGLTYETAFPFNSENQTVWEGFHYRPDPLRIHQSTFFQIPYLLGEALGVGGSFVPYQVVYALLWWARGFLVFAILQRMLPRQLSFNYLAGALVLLHASDGALQWVGQITQFGYMFWLLLAFYLLVAALQCGRRFGAVFLGSAAVACGYMSLWTYESQIFLILLVPLMLVFWQRKVSRRLLVLSASWWAIPGVYLCLAAVRYSTSSSTYQMTVLGKDRHFSKMLGDEWYNIAWSMSFWRWMREPLAAPEGLLRMLGLTGAVVLAAGAAWMVWREPGAPKGGVSGNRAKPLLAASVIGAAILALSFPVYLLLAENRNLWRTQFLSGIGMGILCAAAIALGVCTVRVRVLKWAGLAIPAAVIAFFGIQAAVNRGAIHRAIWDSHRESIARLLTAVPALKPGTFVVLVEVPKDADPFGHNMWLDMAIRLAYPRTLVAGTYFFEDQTPSPGANLELRRDRWEWDGTGMPPIVRQVSISSTVVVSLPKTGDAKLLQELPGYLRKTPDAGKAYQPSSLLSAPRPPARALHRYGPLPD